MGFETIIGIILMLCVVVWFLFELTSLVRIIAKRIRDKKSKKEVQNNADSDCSNPDGNTGTNH